MIHLIKDSCLNQLQLETILDTPIKLCQLIKNRGRKLLNEDLKPEIQTKIQKLVLFRGASTVIRFIKKSIYFFKDMSTSW
jgi:hypothetical protein